MKTRALSFLIDYFISIPIFVLFFYVLTEYFGVLEEKINKNYFWLIYLFYFLLTSYFLKNRTIGMRLMKQVLIERKKTRFTRSALIYFRICFFSFFFSSVEHGIIFLMQKKLVFGLFFLVVGLGNFLFYFFNKESCFLHDLFSYTKIVGESKKAQEIR